MIAWSVRQRLRPIRRELSVAKDRLLQVFGRRRPARVVAMPPTANLQPIAHPAIAVVPPPNGVCDRLDQVLAGQTETSWVLEPEGAGAPYLWCPGDGVEQLEASHLEALLLAAVAADHEFVVAGRAVPGGQPMNPPGIDPGCQVLIRRPTDEPPKGPVPGCMAPHIGPATAGAPLAPPGIANPPYFLDREGLPGSVIRLPTAAVDRRLENLPSAPGPHTILFLLPFLAVGGAERLLFDLVAGLPSRYRVMVATLDAHRPAIGQTVDRCRRLVPHTYTLGDWMPRESRIGAVRHLLRRYGVRTLVSWNGTVDFFDHALDLKSSFPDLRIYSQLYNHEGGWIDRLRPDLLAALDGHLAVNAAIGDALVRRGAPPERVHTIHHGVAVPDPPTGEEQRRRREALRADLGIPADAVVAGTFIRLHRQKRPLDVIRLARRFNADDLHFLLVGGGPEEEAVERAIRNEPPPNLHRLPQTPDATRLYAAIDICLLTSAFEGLPIFLLDGMAREIPCVATAVGEIPEALGDGGGVIVDRPGDLDGLEAALTTMLDSAKRLDAGRRGRAAVLDRYGLDRYVAAYDAVFAGGDPQ